ncbi:putative nuclease HARBI1 [Diorhabda carinulata]|uniref:putative nuclease HARBI1 n=1 Tax=Diorhabda carinulata TaxID=1163345 RepID=UPI0025A2A351|nr:putative nuclease HARBI1 [Diorhabda carinulata]
MSEAMFNELLSKVRPKIIKQDTNMREAISVKLKLQITLRYLATGDSYSSLAYLHRDPKNTISNFMKNVLEEIYSALQEFIKVPQTQEEWKEIQDEFYWRRNFPHCCGAIDGKHVVIKKMPNSGSEFYNYKGTFSVILLATVDANYCFRYVDVETNGRANDAAVFAKSSLNDTLQENILVSTKWRRNAQLTKKQKIFNYRLSRARRIVKNTFGILVSLFRVFDKPIALNIDKVNEVIKACCALHNWLRTRSSHSYTPTDAWQSRCQTNQALQNVRQLGSNNYSRNAASLRESYADYFSAGESSLGKTK